MKKPTIILGMIMASSLAQAMSLDEYLRQVQSRNHAFRSYEVSKEAADAKKVAGDIELTPMLTAEASYLVDKSPTNTFVQLLSAKESKISAYSLGVAKKFSTGTAVSVTAKASDFENPGSSSPSTRAFATGSLGVALQQSLLKDGFGSGTSLRQDRESSVALAEKQSFNLQQRVILTQAEIAYWDLLYGKETLKTAEAALVRAQRIEGWIRNRVSDGISDRADLLSVQALVAGRELAVLNAKDDLIAKEKKLRDTLELSSEEATPQLTGDLNQKRALTDIVGGKGKVISMESQLSALNARARKIGSEEVENAFRPDLLLKASYATNSSETDLSSATANWGDTGKPTTAVALSFSYLFDTEVKASQKNAARKEALAAELQARRKQIESDMQWSELNRRYMELTKKIDAATRIANIQMDRAKAEADKFNKGRSVTSNVINSEQDAADATQSLTMMKIEQRKLEAQGRLFIAEESAK